MSSPPRPEDILDSGYIQPGTEIGFYEVETRLGAGGFGSVYRVLRGGRPYALKLSQARLSDVAPDDRQHMEDRVNREVSALNSLRHPNIVRVHGFERWPDMDGFQFIVMDYVQGAPLLKWRRAKKPSAYQLLLVFKKIALALHEMHRLEVFHRDLKSENVLVRDVEPVAEPVIVDFGLARPRSAYTVTRQDWVLGTLSHFAPEYVQFIESKEYGHSRFAWKPTTDLYALGVMLYEALTGQEPHRGENEGELLLRIKTSIPQRPSLLNAALPGAVDALAMKLLEKSPSQRHQSGEHLAEEIDVLLTRAQTGPETLDAAWAAPLLWAGAGGPESPTVGAPNSTPNEAPGVHPSSPARIRVPVSAMNDPAPAAALQSVDVPLESLDVRAVALELPGNLAPLMAGALPVTADLVPMARASATSPASTPENPPAAPERSPESRSSDKKSLVRLPEVDRASFQSAETGVGADAEAQAAPRQASRAAPGLSTQVRAVAARVEDAGAGKRGSASRTLPTILGVLVLAAVGLVVANKAVQGRSPAAPVDLLAQVKGADERGQTGEGRGSSSGFTFTTANSDLPSGQEAPSHLAPVPPVQAPAPESPTAGLAADDQKPSVVVMKDGAASGGVGGGTKWKGSGGGGNPDQQAINEELAKANFARPKIPGPGAGGNDASAHSGQPGPFAPSPFAVVQRVDGKAADSGPRKFGIPLGTHIRVHLLSNLDSRTDSEAPVEAKLLRTFYLKGEAKLPVGTMFYGEWRASGGSAGGRFSVRFTKLVLPDKSEVPIVGVAIDGEDRKAGLKAGRTITVEQAKGDGTATKVGKATAGVLLGTLPGDTGGQVAQRAGQTVLDGNGSPTSPGQSAALLDSGADFDVFVKEAF